MPLRSSKPPHVELFIHRQTLANVMRFSTRRARSRSRRASRRPPTARSRSSSICSRSSAIRCLRSNRALAAASAALAELDHYAGLAELAIEQSYVRPKIDASLIFAVEDGRHPDGRAEFAAGRRRKLRRQRLQARRRGSRGGDAHPAGDRTQYGRQVDLPPPERADRRAGSVGLVRAGARGPYRHRRPAVQPRRRGRRSRPRPLDLHGRDGRDRRDPQSGERAVLRRARRDRPRHRDLRWTLDCLGDARISARGQPLAACCSPLITTS